jgi:hypothetical protein
MAGSRRPPHFCLEQDVGVAEGEVAVELELEVRAEVAGERRQASGVSAKKAGVLINRECKPNHIRHHGSLLALIIA